MTTKKQPAKQGGRKTPVAYSRAVTEEICRRLAGGESLRKIAEEPGMPTVAGVMKWLHEKEEFVEQYVRARESGIEAHIDGILDIADDGELDPNDKRVRIDARKWIASKLLPKKYGDKQDLNVTGDITIGLAERLASAIKNAGKP